MDNFEHGDVRFFFQGDLDGDIIVQVPAAAVGEPVPTLPGEQKRVEFTVDGKAVKALVLNELRDQAVERLENASDEELADLLWRRL